MSADAPTKRNLLLGRRVVTEPLLGQLLDGTVCDGGINCFVEQSFEIGILFADANADTLSE